MRWSAWADRHAMVVPDTEERVTYGQLAERVGWLAAHLEAMLSQAPDTGPIALCMANSPELLIAVLAIAHCGRVAMPINPGLKADLVAEQCTDTETCLVVVRGAEEAEAALRAAERLSLPTLVVSLDPEKREVARSAGGAWTQRAEVAPDANALLLQTSGTTSKPKWVPLTHRNILASLDHIQQTYALTSEDVSLLVMPLFHGHGLIGVALSTLYSGGCLVIPPRFSAHRFVAWANRYRPTWYSAVPTIHEILLMRDDLAAVTGLRFVRSCSAALAPETAARLEQQLNCPVIAAYGMTETAHQVASQRFPPAPRDPASVGVATGVEIAMIGEQGERQRPGEPGEVVIRGESVMKGYLNNPTANASAFLDGWFRTGDLGRWNEQGELVLIGRSKELINRGGEKIAPAQIDSVLLAMPDIEHAVAFGVPDALYGEVVHVAIQGKPSLTESLILDYCRERLPAFMVPARIHLLERIPTEPNGKISRLGLPRLLGIA